jgi:hypothetical protein
MLQQDSSTIKKSISLPLFLLQHRFVLLLQLGINHCTTGRLMAVVHGWLQRILDRLFTLFDMNFTLLFSAEVTFISVGNVRDEEEKQEGKKLQMVSRFWTVL